MPNIRTIEDHFCNLLYKLYKHWPYHENYSTKLTDRSLIPHIPLDREREALLGLLLQHFFLSQHISIYWGFIACFDFRQAPIYFYEDNLSEYIPLKSQNIIDMVAEAIARIGFLDSHTAFTPGATHAWIDSVVHCMVDPPPSKLEPKQLTFFQYDPLMAHWTIVRWFDNHDFKLKKAITDTKAASSAARTSGGSQQVMREGTPVLKEQLCIRALTNLFNRLVNGVLTVTTGREAYGDTHPGLVEQAVLVDKDSDHDRVLSKLWEVLDAEAQEHWEKVAAQSIPTSQNQQGAGGVALVSCFNSRRVTDGVPITETWMYNKWSDPKHTIPDPDMLPSVEPIFTALHTNLLAILKQKEISSLKLETTFLTDKEKCAWFIYVNAEDPLPGKGRTILQDWFQTLWVQSGRQGPMCYTDICDSPEEFNDPSSFSADMGIVDPRKDMTPNDVYKLMGHFTAKFGVGGKAFHFVPAKQSSTPGTVNTNQVEAEGKVSDTAQDNGRRSAIPEAVNTNQVQAEGKASALAEENADDDSDRSSNELSDESGNKSSDESSNESSNESGNEYSYEGGEWFGMGNDGSNVRVSSFLSQNTPQSPLEGLTTMMKPRTHADPGHPQYKPLTPKALPLGVQRLKAQFVNKGIHLRSPQTRRYSQFTTSSPLPLRLIGHLPRLLDDLYSFHTIPRSFWTHCHLRSILSAFTLHFHKPSLPHLYSQYPSSTMLSPARMTLISSAFIPAILYLSFHIVRV
ncbi:hypothetical protein PQX77_020884 [Marasmius sp. AFHP31]|nr:hypothetical protein PQX77_020884 [Marasmius sp. AFHP31]